MAFCNTHGKGTSGVVKDAITDNQNNRLPGVTVNIKGESKTVVTNNNGMFEINVVKNDALVVSFVDCETQTVAIKERTVINMTMSELSAKGLNEVLAK
ncbi:MAG: carboxypeptidase-like regulatory domain-containing protein [Ginsengibacter sp.]